MHTIIGTWKMSYPALQEANALLAAGAPADEAVVEAIVRVEDNPNYTSVGYGGCPTGTAMSPWTRPSWTGGRCAAAR